MTKNIENNKENQWNNIEKKETNWFKEKWESIKNFLEWKKNIDEIKITEKATEMTDILKDSSIDSQLHDLEKRQEIQDSKIDTKKELDDLLTEWRWMKDSKEILREKELAQELLNNDRFKNRSQGVKEEITRSANNVLTDIENYDKEQNPVARSLLWIVHKIMNTEK